MPVYRVEIEPAAQRDLDRLATTLYERVTGRLAELAEEPRPQGVTKLTHVGAYRLRVGDHRIVYEVDDVSRTMTVTRIRHRREVYRKLR